MILYLPVVHGKKVWKSGKILATFMKADAMRLSFERGGKGKVTSVNAVNNSNLEMMRDGTVGVSVDDFYIIDVEDPDGET